MDNIPYEARYIIDGLVKLCQTCFEPRDLDLFIRRNGIDASFFQQVYEDLHTDKRGKYTALSASEFKRFLEVEYGQQAKAHAEYRAQYLDTWFNQAKAGAERRAQEKADAERQAQAKAKEREEYKKKARADFDALGKEMANATTRVELVELGRKRTELAPYTGVSYVYENHCWNCKAHISSAIHAQCPDCTFYICGSCGACLCGFLNY